MKKLKVEKTPYENFPIFKKHFYKITDPNYSLFNEELKNYKFMKNMLIGSLSIGLPLFALGLSLLIIGQILGIIPITFGGLGIAMLIYLPIFLIDWKKFKFINSLKDNKHIEDLLNTAKKYSLSNSYLEQEQARLATFVLIDFKSRDIGIILKDRLMAKKPQNVRILLKAFNLLSLKLGYNDYRIFFNELVSGKKVQPADNEKEIVDREIVIPITKIYFLENIPANAKCMVSGLSINFHKDQIVACPFCSAWAKKELLEQWLKEKDSCPVCQRKLLIVDCPIVKIKED